MRGALDVHRDLLARDVPHEVVRLRRHAVNADDLPRALDVDATCCVAVRVYVSDVGPAAVAVQAGGAPDLTALLDVLGARSLRPATPDEINGLTDYPAGLVSPLSLPSDLVLVVDAALLHDDEDEDADRRTAPDQDRVLYCPVGEGGVALGIRSRHLLTATAARVAALSALPLPRADTGPWGGGARVIDLDASGPVGPAPRRSVG